MPADYDGDGRTDMAVYNFRTGLWRVLSAANDFDPDDTQTWQTGANGIPAPADYDGDGRADVALWIGDPAVASHVWSVRLSSSNTDVAVAFGESWDVPIAGDYDGDGRADMALFRPSTGTVSINTAANSFSPTTSYCGARPAHPQRQQHLQPRHRRDPRAERPAAAHRFRRRLAQRHDGVPPRVEGAWGSRSEWFSALAAGGFGSGNYRWTYSVRRRSAGGWRL